MLRAGAVRQVSQSPLIEDAATLEHMIQVERVKPGL